MITDAYIEALERALDYERDEVSFIKDYNLQHSAIETTAM